MYVLSLWTNRENADGARGDVQTMNRTHKKIRTENFHYYEHALYSVEKGAAYNGISMRNAIMETLKWGRGDRHSDRAD